MRLDFGGFVPNAWARVFLRNLRRELRGAVPDTGRTAAAAARAAGAVFRDGPPLPDHKARMIRTMCSLALAAVRQVRAETGDPAAAADTVRRAFGRTGAGLVRLEVAAWLWATPDPVRFLSRWSLAALGRRQYGASMEFDEEKSADSVELIVRRCAFHQFFADHGEPGLTPLICAWDRVWMDAVNRSGRPVRTERPSTISTGGACCRFRFVRDGKGRPPDPADVILVELGLPK